MRICLTGILFWICSVIYFYIGSRKYSESKNEKFTKLYFLATSLLSLGTFFCGIYYIIKNGIILYFVDILDFSIMIFVFPIIFNCFYGLFNTKKRNVDLRHIYILPSIYVILFILNEKYENLLSDFMDAGSIFLIFFIVYCVFFAIFTIYILLDKIKNSKKDEYKRNIIYFLLLYIFSISIFVYSYVSSSDMIFLGVRLRHLSLMCFLPSMIIMNLLTGDFYFEDVPPKKILFKILDSMNESVIITDENEKIVYYNKMAGSTVMISPSKNHIQDYIVSEKYKEHKLKENESIEISLNTGNGRISSIMVYSNVYDRFNEIKAKIFIFQSIKQFIEAKHNLSKVTKKLERLVSERTIQLEEMNRKLKSEMDNRVSIEYQIRDIFCYDTLTGLYNRSYFMQHLEKTIIEESDSSHALMFLDLDAFKAINDSLGHSYGDDVLIEIGNRIKSLFKYKNVITSRFGGDEFVILFKDIPNQEYVKDYALKILDITREPIYFDNVRIYTSTSIGISVYPKDGKNTETLTRCADTALYKSKELGKNQFRFFEQEFKKEIENEYEITHNLLSAVSNNELLFHYHPQVTIKNGIATITGLEALMRWQKDGKLIPPGMFIDIAEKSNIITEMGKWGIFEACNQCAKWNKTINPNLRIAINLSSNQLMNPMLCDEVSMALDESGVDPSNIELEITETSIVKNIKNSVKKLSLLKELGIRISVDDFGTKYSTFNYLKQLPIDKIKIDISFVRGIGNNKIDEAIIASLISLSKELGVDIIAEGVETQQQLEFLLKNGCNSIQGFYFFKPMPSEKIENEDILNYRQNDI